MNNQQAINLLKNLEQSLDDYCGLNDEGKTAFRMAIAALELFGNAEQFPSAQPETQWIPVSDKLPEPLKAVIITWKNHEPQFYYSDIKNKPFIGVGIYYKDKWWWWSAYAEDMLEEYGDSKADRMDKAIEVIAWMPLPEPYRVERRTDEAD